MDVTLRTLTPLWTGGVDGTMGRIHETGLIGSLRWWYEAIVRGLGGSACDPTDHTCSFDAERYHKSKARDERQRLREAGLCDVCQVFGATGWRRRFRLSIIEDKTQPVWMPVNKALNIRPPRRQRGWYLMPGHMGELVLSLQGDAQVISMLACLLLWLEKFGTLGARPQLGYGAFTIVNHEEILSKAQKWQWTILGQQEENKKFPDLRRFLFFRYIFSPSQPGWWTKVPGVGRVGSQVQPLVSQWNTVPTTPALKNEWRFNRWQGSRREEIEIFGTLYPDRRRGRIGATWAYKKDGQWEIHGWAWMPAKDKTAGRLWDILTDKDIWAQVLGVQGHLQTKGKQHWSTQEIQQFLQGVYT